MVLYFLYAITFIIALVIIHKPLVKGFVLLFNIWWLLWIFMSIIRPYGEHHVTEYTYKLIFLVLLSQNIGLIISGIVFRNVNKVRDSRMEGDTSIITSDTETLRDSIIKLMHSKYLLIVFYILFAVSVYYFIKYRSVVVKGTLDEARLSLFYVGNLFSSVAELLFFNYVITPLTTLCGLLFCVNLIYNKMNRTGLLCLANYIIYSFIGAGRGNLANLMGYLFVVFLIHWITNEKKIKIKNFKTKAVVMVILLSIVIIGMPVMTAIRYGIRNIGVKELTSFAGFTANQFIDYNTGAIGSLDVMVSEGKMINQGWFGRYVLWGGIDEIVGHFLRFLNFDYTPASVAYGAITVPRIMVGNQDFNALYTSVFTFFTDSGYIGLVIFPLLLGLKLGIILRVFCNKKSLSALLISTICIYYAIQTNLNWYFSSPDKLIVIVFIYIFTKCISKSDKIKGASQ